MCDYDNEIDAIGLKCPMPILKCKKGLNSLEIGQTLRIKTTDNNDIMRDANQQYHHAQ